jgi:molybdopterin/thiamine biosynthesis adenylyltransferase
MLANLRQTLRLGKFPRSFLFLFFSTIHKIFLYKIYIHTNIHQIMNFALHTNSFINTRCPWMKVTPHFGDIKQKSASWYGSFQCIIAGLDSVEARRWLNAMVCSLVKFDDDGDPDPTSIVPIIDGGSEAFKGQVRVILPRITSCFECSLDSFPPQRMFPLCTIAETPRLPEHCISYAFMLEVRIYSTT